MQEVKIVQCKCGTAMRLCKDAYKCPICDRFRGRVQRSRDGRFMCSCGEYYYAKSSVRHCHKLSSYPLNNYIEKFVQKRHQNKKVPTHAAYLFNYEDPVFVYASCIGDVIDVVERAIITLGLNTRVVEVKTL